MNGKPYDAEYNALFQFAFPLKFDQRLVTSLKHFDYFY